MTETAKRAAGAIIKELFPCLTEARADLERLLSRGIEQHAGLGALEAAVAEANRRAHDQDLANKTLERQLRKAQLDLTELRRQLAEDGR